MGSGQGFAEAPYLIYRIDVGVISDRARLSLRPSTRELERSAMKYTVSMEIAVPRERVVQLLADPAHLPKWLRGLVPTPLP